MTCSSRLRGEEVVYGPGCSGGAAESSVRTLFEHLLLALSKSAAPAARSAAEAVSRRAKRGVIIHTVCGFEPKGSEPSHTNSAIAETMVGFFIGEEAVGSRCGGRK